MLREAFMGVLKDKAFLEDAKLVSLDIAPLSGEKVQETVAAIYAAPKEVAQRARELIVP
jgi:hypothetical protein